MKLEIRHKSSESRGKFFIEENGVRKAWLAYSITEGNQMNLNYVEVIPALRGGMMGKRMVNHAVSYARDHNLKVQPVCSFIQSVMHQDDSYQDVLAQ